MMGHPLKQGLKPQRQKRHVDHRLVMMGHPLKQGLKLAALVEKDSDALVMMGHPLKQGLKQIVSISAFTGFRCYDGTSIKTRIETLGLTSASYLGLTVMMGHPLKQGLKLVYTRDDRKML